MITRLAQKAISAYRAHVDADVGWLLERAPSSNAVELLQLGCHHERQQQELLDTDILHLPSQTPLQPAYKNSVCLETNATNPGRAAYNPFEGGVVEIGGDGNGFGFDCERPRHRVFLEVFRLADRLVTNEEWLEFISGRGYSATRLWLSEGWAKVHAEGSSMPLYWVKRDDEYWTVTPRGARKVNLAPSVARVSNFEADADAWWAGQRIVTGAKREHPAQSSTQDGNLADTGHLQPTPTSSSGDGVRQMFGDVWEWTRSPHSPCAPFRAVEGGAVGECNGKFMSGQFGLHGGSCMTPPGRIAPSYRNFFPPEARWQFSGLRPAEDM